MTHSNGLAVYIPSRSAGTGDERWAEIAGRRTI